MIPITAKVYENGIIVNKTVYLEMTICSRIKCASGVIYETNYTKDEIAELWDKSIKNK